MNYLKSHSRRVRSMVRVQNKGNDGGEYVQAILKWVRRNRLDSFSERDLNRNFPRFAEKPKELMAALAWLDNRQCIRRRPDPNRPPGSRGRKHSAVFDVNPRLIATLEARGTAPERSSSVPGSEHVNNVKTAGQSTEQGRKEAGHDQPPV